MENNALQPQVIEATALEVLNRSEIDIQIATAKQYPRDLKKVLGNIRAFATLDEETAEAILANNRSHYTALEYFPYIYYTP